MRNNTPPALVLGLGPNGLGVARSLWSAGIRVIGLDPDPKDPSTWSWAFSSGTLPSLSGQPLLAALEAFVAQHGAGAVLFPTQELTVRTLVSDGSGVLKHFRYTLPPDDVIEPLLTKDGFYRLAEQVGSPIPRTVVLGKLDDLAPCEALRWPCVLKPADRDPVYDRRFAKAYRVESFPELQRLYEAIVDVKPDMVVQEWVHGGDSSLYFCLQYRTDPKGRGFSFCGRKIRVWPPDVGGTASCAPAPEYSEELTELTDAFFGAHAVPGFAALEFKRRPEDGRFLMIEPTMARTDYQAEIATLNGVNLPLCAYRSLTGGPLPEARVPAVPQLWRDRESDLHSGLESGDPSMPFGQVNDALFRWRDPGPWLAMRMQRLSSTTRRIAGGP